ncbi:ABC-type multidrug transport system, ATPase component [Halogeometricum borinquense DSM 11551]|uniref:ABC-type multidrug transport system, ATPase component n=1 Tax=Halogeometricum borinquense (strain ATCC 700274 / DSM 11551 / JCM 10706 / KCTC 4070 / PR3) TaxID=469382 RepID=E4NUD3_HALBP|nr:ABC transporter ATP-binding protein [Halogeometricum borinquense]ADQ68653.1 ABC-type multidrug transport system, ATPase component [Halogeometricum borinquense DSM 11551]ELY25394.1 ABC-type multidrug transport system, ATPase component [Halogeometricum borinquense DSM 11551]
MTAIDITNFTKEYKSTTAVDGLNLSVKEGEVYGFLGPNGAGKSTTIDALMNYIQPTSGQIEIFGLDAREDASQVHSRVGILPDQFDVYARLTGRQHIEFVANTKGVDINTDTLLNRVGLEDAKDSPAQSYSKGMQQRLGLAMALVGDPDLLILDEPFSGLDPFGTQLVRDIVMTQTNRGTTVFFSSHVLEQVERVCGRIGLLDDGQLVAEGKPREIRASADVKPRLVVALAQPKKGLTEVQDIDSVSDVNIDGDGYLSVVSESAHVFTTVLNRLDSTNEIQWFDVEFGTIEDAFIENTNS